MHASDEKEEEVFTIFVRRENTEDRGGRVGLSMMEVHHRQAS
jgi:hypothetical protein